MTDPEPEPALSFEDRTADELMNALLTEIERDPAKALAALRERFPQRDTDEQQPPE